MSSHRLRPPTEKRHLTAHGSEIGIYQLQGGLGFATIEPIIRDAVAEADQLRYLILDFRRVQSINESAAHLMHDLVLAYDEKGKAVVFAHAGQHRAITRVIETRLARHKHDPLKSFADYDAALEWCENRIINHYSSGTTMPAFINPEANELLNGLTAEQSERFSTLLMQRDFAAEETIITAGERARNLFLIESGQASVFVDTPGGTRKRIATFCPGMVFGELALIDDSPRSATVVADTAVKCAVLEAADLDALGQREPAIKIQILKNLALSLSEKLRNANRSIKALE